MQVSDVERVSNGCVLRCVAIQSDPIRSGGIGMRAMTIMKMMVGELKAEFSLLHRMSE